MCYNRILDLEKLTHYKGINANGEWDPVHYGIITENEFRAILEEANEKIRCKARSALADKKSVFEAL